MLKKKLQVISRLAEEADRLSIDEFAERIAWQLEMLCERIERKENEAIYTSLKQEMDRGQRLEGNSPRENVELKVKAGSK